MLSWPWCRTIPERSNVQATPAKAFRSSSSSQPPIATPLDLVLQKAARKVKLVHPVAQNDQKWKEQEKLTKAKEPTKQPTPRPIGSPATKQPTQTRLPHPPVDDDTLFNEITESERDSIWEAFKLEVELGSDDEDWLEDPEDSTFGRHSLPPQRRRAPASARDDSPSTSPRTPLTTPKQSVVSISGFKGFGTPPRQAPPQPVTHSLPSTTQDKSVPAPKPRQLAPSNNSSSHHTAPQARSATTSTMPPTLTRSEAHGSHRPSQPSQRRQAAPGQARGPVSYTSSPPTPPIRVFLFNAEEARTQSLLQQLGLEERVRVVDDLRCADAVVATKLARSGKHVNLAQGERTAANLGIPFLVVGRNMSADNLWTALMPLLNTNTAGGAAAASPAPTASSEGLNGSPAAVAAAAAAATGRPGIRAPTAAELQAHRLEVMHGFAQLLREGAPSGAGTR